MNRIQRTLMSLILIPVIGLGQESDFKVISNSSQIIEQLNSRAKEIKTFQCDFKQQKYMSYLEATVESKGKFMLKNQNQVRWEYLNPYQYLIVINKGKISFKTRQQKDGTAPNENKLFDQLNSIVQSAFKGKLGQDNNFTTTLLENNMSYKLNLIPKSSEMRSLFKEINLWFDKTTLNISGMQIIEASGDYTMLTFDKLLYNKTIPDSEFIIN